MPSRMGGGGRLLKEEVDEEDIAKIVSKWTGIPVDKMLEGEVRKLVEMEGRLRERVVGQEEAIETVANAIRRSRAGRAIPNGPLAPFSSWDPPASARLRRRVPWRSSCSMMSRP